MLICPARMDLISLPCRASPASNFSSRKYSKVALRLVAKTFTSSAIMGYYHNPSCMFVVQEAAHSVEVVSTPLKNRQPGQQAQNGKQYQRVGKPQLVSYDRTAQGAE